MCGLVGFMAFTDAGIIDRQLLERMRDTMVHRGPDGAGIWVSGDRRIGLAHRRLAIIDLSNAASQPMASVDGSSWICFNGEIYNHAEIRAELEQMGDTYWKTDHSDTEVILHAFAKWGIECVERFRGMFAFALWDGKARHLWLVRDRVGIKPLYYSLRGEGITFASEIKALLAHPSQPRAFDETALTQYLSFLAVPAPATLFAGISKVPPATWLRIDEHGTVTRHRYWDPLAKAPHLEGVSEDDIAERLLAELRTSVRLRLVSDVPVGAFLSGGIDSTTNVALLREREAEVRTFTVGYAGQTSYRNETEEARKIAAYYGTEHHDRLLTIDDLMSFLPRMVYQQDEPIADPVCVPIYYLSRLARDNGVIVTQVGEGADELFLGYPSWRLQWGLERLGDLFPRLAKDALLRGLALARHESTRQYEYLRRSAAGAPVFWGGAEAFTPIERQRLLRKPLLDRVGADAAWAAVKAIHDNYLANAERPSPLTWMSYMDLNLRLPELLLMRVDKMGMAASVEGRVPFLDHKLVELAFGIPSRLRLRHGRLKYILKRAVRGLVPREVLVRRKQGFGVPVGEWLLDRLGREAAASIERMVKHTDLFESSEVRRQLTEGRASRVWFLLNLALWWERFLE